MGAAPISGLARKHETRSLLKPDPYPSPVTVLKLTCNALRTRGKSIRNCRPCKYWLLVRCVVLCSQPALLMHKVQTQLAVGNVKMLHKKSESRFLIHVLFPTTV